MSHLARSQRTAQRPDSNLQPTPPRDRRTSIGHMAGTVQQFALKLANDGVMQFAGMLAYNLLLAIVPLLVGLLGLISFVFFITGHSASDLTAILTAKLAHSLSFNGANAIAVAVKHEAGTIGVIGILLSLVGGAGFFLNVDYAFSIILRLKQRDIIHAYLMAISMVLLQIPLIIVMLLATSIPQALNALASQVGVNSHNNAPLGIVWWLISYLAGTLTAFILLSVMYVVVPNQKVAWRDTVWGALIAAILLEAYTLLFPLYAAHFLKYSTYGASLGFAVVILVFFYYFSVILLLGVEVNSWIMGHHEPRESIPDILHYIPDYGTTKQPELTVPSVNPIQRRSSQLPGIQRNRPVAPARSSVAEDTHREDLAAEDQPRTVPDPRLPSQRSAANQRPSWPPGKRDRVAKQQ